jgi:hypothetical protein
MFKRLIIAAIIGALCGAPVRANLLLTGAGGIGGSGVSNFLTQSYTGSCTTFAGCYTFSRAGNAMVYDSTGALTYAPNNLYTYSNTFSNSAWAWYGGGTATAGFSDPFGGNNAYKIVPAAEPSYHDFSQEVAYTPGVNYIVSEYIKPAGYTILTWADWNASTWLTFDFTAVTATIGGSDAGMTISHPSITSVGNGWYLISAVFNITAIGRRWPVRWIPSMYYTATDGVSGFYIYGATLSAVTYETTPRSGDQVVTGASAYYGPRFDYPNSTAAGLLLEPTAATNYLFPSNDFTISGNWATIGTVTLTAAAGTSPDGTTNATRVQLSAAAPTTNILYFSPSNGVNLGQNVTNTGSLWVKSNTGSSQTFQLGVTQSSVANYYSSDLTATTSWQRFSYSPTFGAGGNGISVRITNGSGGAANDLLIYGAQAEAGVAFASSYMPNTSTAASVTRAAESLTATPAALGWSDTTGTLIVEGTFPPVNQLGVIANVQGASLELELQESNAANNAAGQYEGAYASSSTNWVYDSTTNLPVGSPVRAGVQIISGTDYLSANGNALITGSTVGSLSSTSINFGQRNGGTNQLAQLHLRSLGVYNTAMSSVAFQAKTTVGASY